jgi:hypothetical protein
MKGKKGLFLATFMLMMLIGLAASGAAVASPAKAPAHFSACVSGTVELISETPGSQTINQETGEVVMIGTVVTYAFHGDLEGTFRETLIERGSLVTGLYTLHGRVTFVGTLNGKKVRWAGCTSGNGFLDPASAGTAGWEKSTITVISSAGAFPHLRGSIKAYGSWTAESGSGTYGGWLFS